MQVPGVASGGGEEVSVLKRGCMCPSVTTGLGGLDVSGLILGRAARSSKSSSSGICEGKGPSRGRAGESGREPGIGSKVMPSDDVACTRASLVSQVSNPSDWEPLSIE